MKSFFTNIAYLVVFAIVFSSLTGCSGTSNVASNGTAAANSNTGSNAAPKDPSTYPPLVSGVAEADMELADGTMAKLSGRKGEVLLVNLWGIWCGPCRAEMPHLVELQEMYKDKGFKVIGLNVGDEDGQPEDFARIKEFGTKMGLNYELVRAPRAMTSEIYKLTRFDAVPQSLLIDRDGHLRGVLRGGGPKAIVEMKQTVARAMGAEPGGSVPQTGTISGEAPDAVKAPGTKREPGPDGKVPADKSKESQ